MDRSPDAPGGVGGNPAISLAGTTGSTPGGKVDLLESPAQLSRWLEAQAGGLGPPGEDTALRLQAFRSLRQAVREAFLAAARGEALPHGAVLALNDASAAVPRYTRLDVSDPADPKVIRDGAGGSRTSAILASIAQSAIEILGGPDRARLRICGGPRCGRFFLADRPRQVWCTKACGNRARVARHYARTRGPR